MVHTVRTAGVWYLVKLQYSLKVPISKNNSKKTIKKTKTGYCNILTCGLTSSHSILIGTEVSAGLKKENNNISKKLPA
jgi:hypothetical protein